MGRHSVPKQHTAAWVAGAGVCLTAILVAIPLLYTEPANPVTTAQPPVTTAMQSSVTTIPPAPVTTAMPSSVTTIPPASVTTTSPLVTTTIAPAPVTTTTTRPVADLSKCDGLKVKKPTYEMCSRIVSRFPEIPKVLGFGQREGNPTSCHPRGLAIDIMTYRDRALGDRVYAYILDNKVDLRATTVLWRVANHYDHIHISTLPCVH